MRLFGVQVNGLLGYINASGKIVIQPTLHSGMRFTEGLAGACRAKSGKWGFINLLGEFAIEPKFDSCKPFSEGLGLVKLGKRFQYIDKSGAVKLELDYYRCESFRGGIARVQKTMRDNPVFIDAAGRPILSGLDFHVSRLGDGLINCGDGNLWGYIDTTGNYVISPQWRVACHFAEGLAAVAGDPYDPVFGFIDTGGVLRIEMRYRGSDIQFSEGLCAVWSEMGFGFIDHAGTLAIPHSYYYAGHFSNGLSVVQHSEDAKYGFIGLDGSERIPAAWDHADSFSDGLAGVMLESGKKRLEGYIDTTGRVVWPPSA